MPLHVLLGQVISERASKQASETLFNVGYNAIQHISQKAILLHEGEVHVYLQMKNIDVHNILQGFNGIHFA